MMKQQKPKVGAGVMILKEGKVLFEKKSSRREGECAFPGGHFEYMDSFAE